MGWVTGRVRLFLIIDSNMLKHAFVRKISLYKE